MHGWLVDKDTPEVSELLRRCCPSDRGLTCDFHEKQGMYVGKRSYNQLVEVLIAADTAETAAAASTVPENPEEPAPPLPFSAEVPWGP